MAIVIRNDLPEDIRDWLTYDSESGAFFWKMCRYKSKIGKRADGTIHKGYRRITIRGRSYSAHRLAWFFHFGEMPPALIDHINSDGTDNRIANLRPATGMQNGCNRTNNTSHRLLKGVTWNRRVGKYQAQIKANRKSSYLGLFETEAEAHEAYAAAAALLHGEYARAE